MDLKFTFAATALGASLYCLARWRRSGGSFAGNELVLLPPLLACYVLVPGEPAVCVMRLALHTSLFGAFIFWNSMLKKVRKAEFPIFVYPAVAVFLYEAVMWYAGAGTTPSLWGYLFLGTALWGAFFIYAYMVREKHPGMKNSISINKLVEQVAVMSPFVVLSGVSVSLLLFSGMSDVWAYVWMHLFLGMHLWYIYYEKPLFMDTRQQDEISQLRRRGYVTGRVMRGGQVLEDDGGGVADEGIVEDARIIHALMVLFEKERLYMNVDIKIANVALMIGTNKTYLSRALNTRLSKNFCQFVNYYRVREACMMFLDNPHVEMRELAEQCGFNSSSNFSIVFKYNTGFSPGDWCRMVKMKLDNNESVSVDEYLL